MIHILREIIHYIDYALALWFLYVGVSHVTEKKHICLLVLINLAIGAYFAFAAFAFVP